MNHVSQRKTATSNSRALIKGVLPSLLRGMQPLFTNTLYNYLFSLYLFYYVYGIFTSKNDIFRDVKREFRFVFKNVLGGGGISRGATVVGPFHDRIKRIFARK